LAIGHRLPAIGYRLLEIHVTALGRAIQRVAEVPRRQSYGLRRQAKRDAALALKSDLATPAYAHGKFNQNCVARSAVGVTIPPEAKFRMKGNRLDG
jgi:hypothetical protein